MKYYLLCSGSKGNCCVIQSKNTTVAIDCGNTGKYLREAFESIKIDYKSLDALLLTHEHSDHISQLKMFSCVKKYSPFEIKYEFYPVILNTRFQIKDLKIQSIALSHDTHVTSGYIIDDGEERLVYITDTGYIRQDYLSPISNADYYILESNHDVEMLMKSARPYPLKMRINSDEGHLNNAYCRDTLQKVIGEKTREVVLAHISEECNTEELALSTSAPVLKDTGILLKAGRQSSIVSGGN